MTPRRVCALSLTLEFPQGVAISDGRDESALYLARDLRGQPILRGSSLAGALRNGLHDPDLENRYFGHHTAGKSFPSHLNIPDVSLKSGQGQITERTHIGISRDTGAAARKALFTIEYCPPGTVGDVVIWLNSDEEKPDDDLDFINRLARMISSGIMVGGHKARGVGFCRARTDTIFTKWYELADPTTWGSYLNDHWVWRKSKQSPAGDPASTESSIIADLIVNPTVDLTVDLQLTIPCGQDLLIANGRGVEHDLEAQKVILADESTAWLLPGSALRGVIRDWMERLAKREMGSEDGSQKIEDLFGSVEHKGRILFSDGLAPCKADQEQVRMHVTVDPVSGGARDQSLFDNTVLIGDPDNPVVFSVRVFLDHPEEVEVKWLIDTLKAMDTGVLRFGSSKAAGCLCLMETPQAQGEYAKMFEDLAPNRWENRNG